MNQSSEKIVRKFLNAVQTGDEALPVSQLDPSEEWTKQGHNRFSGTKNSSKEVFEMVGKIYAHTVNKGALAGSCI